PVPDDDGDARAGSLLGAVGAALRRMMDHPGGHGAAFARTARDWLEERAHRLGVGEMRELGGHYVAAALDATRGRELLILGILVGLAGGFVVGLNKVPAVDAVVYESPTVRPAASVNSAIEVTGYSLEEGWDV